MTRILIIGYVWPEPSSSAAGAHMLSLLAACQSVGWGVTFASPATHTEHMTDLGALDIQTVEIALNCSSFDRFVSELQPQLVLFDRFMMEEQFGWRVEKACPQALRMLDTVDLFCLRHARHDAFKQHDRIETQITKSQLHTEMAQREIAAIYRCDLSLVISEVELQLLVDTFGLDPALLHYYPLSVNINQIPPAATERDGFIAIGNFRHPPNWDAVRWLNAAIWPKIRKALPQAQCRIYGAYTPPKAQALHNAKQGFHVLGRAADALEVMSAAKVNLAPLRFGAGLKGKLLDAMVSGTPSVTTCIGAEGMQGQLPFPGAIADDPQTIADQAIALYQDQPRWQQAQQAGYDIVRQRFDQSVQDAHLLERIEEIRGNLQSHRVNNFTGAMLRHHAHRSTQYMSQWIEAKNRVPTANSQEPS